MRGALFCRACYLLMLLVGIVACRERGQRVILPPAVTLRPGDVVFRSGRGMASYMVVAADRGGRYSHVGMAVDSCGVVMIAHAVPDELDFKGDVDRVKLDTPERFFSSERAIVGEVCRPQDSVRAARAAEVAWQAYRRRVLFDHGYDDSDTTRMYCSELVVYALGRAGYDLSALRRQEVNVPGVHACCILPSGVHSLPFLVSVAEF